MTMNLKPNPELLTLPNLLTCFRFVIAPVLLWLAWHGYKNPFLVLLAVAFLSDALDGIAARLTGQVTQFGAMLDSWADVIIYLIIAISAWWLWPSVVKRELIYVILIISSYLLPAIVGMLKFGSFTSYHTWMVKFAAATMALTLYILFLGGPAWPFRIASIICVLAAAEEIAITLLLSEKRSNISSLWNVLKNLTQRSSQPNRHNK
jgi:phosphatidylglycerophosphate synthase